VDVCNPSKDCICYSVDPLTLSGKVIRSLGQDFCKIPAVQITDEELQKKNLTKKGAAAVQASQIFKKGGKKIKISQTRESGDEVADSVTLSIGSRKARFTCVAIKWGFTGGATGTTFASSDY
jgi:hypothetical protein